MHSLLASQRLQECAKICIKKCKRAKNWKIVFADVCIFFFDGSHICRFLPILRPLPFLGVTLDTLKQRHLR